MDPQFNATRTLTWDEVHRDSRRLARLVREGGPIRGLVAVTRGGLVPAAVLARELDIRLVETVCISSYGDGTRHELTVLKSLAGDGAGWLVVDDLADTGETIRVVRGMLSDARVATLYVKPAGRPLVDWFAAEVDQRVWIVFPWDGPGDE